MQERPIDQEQDLDADAPRPGELDDGQPCGHGWQVEIGRRRRGRDAAQRLAVTAGHLGNTPAVVRRSYVHPAVLEAYLDGSLPADPLGVLEPTTLEIGAPPAASVEDEAAVLALLRLRLDGADRRPRSKADS